MVFCCISVITILEQWERSLPIVFIDFKKVIVPPFFHSYRTSLNDLNVLRIDWDFYAWKFFHKGSLLFSVKFTVDQFSKHFLYLFENGFTTVQVIVHGFALHQNIVLIGNNNLSNCFSKTLFMSYITVSE